MYNKTVRATQLIMNTPDPCNQYKATVAALCQGNPATATAEIKIPGSKSVNPCNCIAYVIARLNRQ